MPSVEASGTQTATGGEDTLLTSTDAKAFVLTIDISAMQGGDTLSVRGYVKATAGGTLTQVIAQTFTGAPSDPDKSQVTIALPSPYQMSFRIQQTAGTNRAYPWNVSSLCTVSVESTGTITTTAAEQTIGAAVTSNKMCVLLTDHSLQGAAGQVTLKVKMPAINGGTDQIIYQTSPTAGVLADPEKVQLSAPLPAPYKFLSTIQRIAGADYNVPYSIVSIAA